MVKNLHGGRKHKLMGRKFVNAKKNELRIKKDDAEIYGRASAILGNNMFYCKCSDGKERLCRIRGKFSGRNKRDNIINRGTLVLVGLYEWNNSKGDKVDKCDLLEVYNLEEESRLKDLSLNINWSSIEVESISSILSSKKDMDSCVFLSENDEMILKYKEEINNKDFKILKLLDEEEIVDVDNI